MDLINKDNNKIKELFKNKKVLIIIGIVLVIGLGLFFILNKDIIKNGFILDNGKPIVKEIKVDNKLKEISVISSRIESVGKFSSIFIKIKNNTGSDIDKSDLKLTIYDKNNKLLLTSYIKEFNDFKVNEEREFQVSTNSNISDASKYVVEKVE